ncbi:MAG: DUF308 domain-containing protein [Lachnospiraceae bacterium]|nr:DUF308 domain-containing protein [Lachnospiraceae bacterium]
MEFFNKIKTNMILNAVLTILIGIFFIINPGGTGRLIGVAAGIVILISGIVDITRFLAAGTRDLYSNGSLIIGVVKLVIGIVILTHTGAFLSLPIYLFGIYVLIGGINSMSSAIRIRQAGIPGWAGHAVLAAAIIAAAVFMMLFPFAVVNTAIMVSGVILIADGVIGLASGIRTNRM